MLRWLFILILLPCVALSSAEQEEKPNLALPNVVDVNEHLKTFQERFQQTRKGFKEQKEALVDTQRDAAKESVEQRDQGIVSNANQLAARLLNLDKRQSNAIKEALLQEQAQLMVLVSSSLPDRVIRQYAHALEKIPGASLVIRGFVGGVKTIGETTTWIARVTKKDKLCEDLHCERYRTPVVVHPQLFERYQVTAVPTVVVDFEKGIEGQCSEHNEGGKSGVTLVGAIKLDYALERIYELSNNPKVKQWLTLLTH